MSLTFPFLSFEVLLFSRRGSTSVLGGAQVALEVPVGGGVMPFLAKLPLYLATACGVQPAMSDWNTHTLSEMLHEPLQAPSASQVASPSWHETSGFPEGVVPVAVTPSNST